jgi:hypothetical protein
MADASGFAALACDEMLLHTSDITASLGVGFDPPRQVCARVLARLFPWAPHDQDAWGGPAANGRGRWRWDRVWAAVFAVGLLVFGLVVLFVGGVMFVPAAAGRD